MLRRGLGRIGQDRELSPIREADWGARAARLASLSHIVDPGG